MRRSDLLFALLLSFVLAGCGTKQTLEQAIKCDQFSRNPDGTWTTKNVSLNFVQDGREYQMNYGDGSIITRKKGDEDALILAALEKKCAPKP